MCINMEGKTLDGFQTSSNDNPDQLREATELQLSELEMIQSMYPGPKEVVVDTASRLLERWECVRAGNQRGYLQYLPRLEYTINITLDHIAWSLEVSLPALYPLQGHCEPRLYCHGLVGALAGTGAGMGVTKQQLATITAAMLRELQQMEVGELSVGLLLAWLVENAPLYTASDPPHHTGGPSPTSVPAASQANTAGSSGGKHDKFCRMWVYSHHIYSKVKRKELQQLSAEYDLTGFVLPGKPGLVCVEGTAANTEHWWQLVRSWNWQKIVCKQIESATLKPGENLTAHRRFPGFSELGSGDGIRVKAGGFHVDMGDLFRYLVNHNSGYMFREYFGVDGRE